MCLCLLCELVCGKVIVRLATTLLHHVCGLSFVCISLTDLLYIFKIPIVSSLSMDSASFVELTHVVNIGIDV